jgi:GUN4-like
MLLCPVCHNESLEGKADCCSVCGWDLTPNPPGGKLSKAYLKKEQMRLDWARRMWANSQVMGWEVHLGELRSQLQAAAVERSYLQSQLEWVLYRLEQMNPELIAESLSRLEEKISAMPEQVPPMSEVGIDYRQLMQFLGAGKWRKADEHTWEIMLQIAFREEEGWLSATDIEKFPCTDLRTIDQLWEYYSSGLFGLNVQQGIWEKEGKNYTQFCDRVGWRRKDNWAYYDDLNFSLSAPEGHLPAIAWRKRACYGMGKSMASENFVFFTSRLLACDRVV